jgi:hypothetical protein
MDRTMLENPWIKLGFDMWTLGIQAASVVTLRMLKIGTGGPVGAAEARRMVTERIESGFAVQVMTLSDEFPVTARDAARKTLVHHGRKARANIRPLVNGEPHVGLEAYTGSLTSA